MNHRCAVQAPLPVLLFACVLAAGCAATPPPRDSARPAGTTETAASHDAAGGIEPTVVSHPEYRDPLIALNRAVFAFNDVTYRYLLTPLSRGYHAALPGPVRIGIGNFFHNIRTPIYFVNHLLQARFREAGTDLVRFGVNSTLGVFGLLDPADSLLELSRSETSFDDTLAGYGTGYGVYLVLPLIGSSDLRDGASRVVDYFLNPIPYALENPESTAALALDSFQDNVPTLIRYGKLRDKSGDPYIFFRNLHLQGSQQDERDAGH